MRLEPPEPFAEWSGDIFCPECERDTDHECHQMYRWSLVEAHCLECGHDHEFEVEEPDVP